MSEKMLNARVFRVLPILLSLAMLVNSCSVVFSTDSHDFNAGAKKIGFESKEYDEDIEIEKNDIEYVDIEFSKGKEMEIVILYTVEDNIPIDFYFVNDDNLLLLQNGAQFLFYIDGTGQQFFAAKRIVLLTEHDDYYFVMANYYSNQTVKVDLSYETRLRLSDESDSDDGTDDLLNSPMFMLNIVFIVIVCALAGICGYLAKRERSAGYRRGRRAEKDKEPDKKRKRKRKNVGKKGNGKDEKTKQKAKKDSKTPTKSTKQFCGSCGKPTDSPFCKNCGEKQ